MPGHTVLITGAGFSKPHGGPLMSELLDHERIRKSHAGTRPLKAVARFHERRVKASEDEGPTLEDIFTEVWSMARTGGEIPISDRSWSAGDLLDPLTLHLASICDSVGLDMRTNIGKDYVSFFERLWEESRSLTIVTFNYDILAEQCLEEADIPYAYGNLTGVDWKNPLRSKRRPRAKDRVDILKLHGSANWGFCRGCTSSRRTADSVSIMNKLYIPYHQRKRCPQCRDSMLEPGIVPPVYGKAGETRPIGNVWKKARQRVDRAREFLVVGYSLPSSDREAMSLMDGIYGDGRRPRVTMVCGPSGAPSSYDEVFEKFDDAECYFEDYLEKELI